MVGQEQQLFYFESNGGKWPSMMFFVAFWLISMINHMCTSIFFSLTSSHFLGLTASLILLNLVACSTHSTASIISTKLANLFPNNYSQNKLLKMLIKRNTNSFLQEKRLDLSSNFSPMLTYSLNDYVTFFSIACKLHQSSVTSISNLY